MSQYGMGESCMTDPELLCLALHELGWTALEVHTEPQNLIGYHGDTRPETAHVIIRRKHISAASNDVGFFVTPDGIKTIISDFDGRRFNAAWLQNLTRVYGLHAGLKEAKRRGKRAERIRDEVTGREKVRVYV